jgi:hypothetical protein
VGRCDWIHLNQNKDQVEGPCEHSNEILGSKKVGSFLTS